MRINIKKLTLTLSVRNLGLQIRYALPRRVINGLTYYDFVWSAHLIKPTWRVPMFKRSDGSWLPISCIVQEALLSCGIAVCNLFRCECTSGFECCSWNVSRDDQAVLQSLVTSKEIQSQKSPEVYVAHVDDGVCRCCGKTSDLREGICFECADRVVVEPIIDGVTSFHDTVGGKTWIS